MQKLSTFSKILMFLGVLAVAGAILVYSGHLRFDRDGEDPLIANTLNPNSNPNSSSPITDGTFKIAFDEGHFFKPIIDANMGVGPTPNGALYRTVGADVEISIINDDEESLQKLINGEIVAVALTVNRWAYVHARLEEAGVPTKMILFTAKSAGLDGIVTTADISDIAGLAGNKIAVSKFSGGHITTEWLLNISILVPEQIAQIRRDMVYTNSAEESFNMLAAGQVDAAFFWEPYVTKSINELGAKSLFATRSAPNIMIIGVICREDYLERFPDSAERFVEATVRAADELVDEVQYVRQLPSFAHLSDEEIQEMSNQFIFGTAAENRELFLGTAQTLYSQMAGIWADLGENVVPNGSETAFADEYFLNAERRISASGINTQQPSSQTSSFAGAGNATPDTTNTRVLLQQTLTINFEPNVAIIQPDSYAALQEFAQIAQLLSGAIIQVEGNIADTGSGDTDSGRRLSLQRAQAVCNYLIDLGIDEERLIAVGHGISNPVPEIDPHSPEGREANRRTDIFFLVLE